ncbi:MAG: hypothetical protein WD749_06880 [Phycisphaerales bacterium]
MVISRRSRRARVSVNSVRAVRFEEGLRERAGGLGPASYTPRVYFAVHRDEAR